MTFIRGKEDLLKRVKISKEKFRLIVKRFVVDCTAIQTTKLVGINHNTADRYFNYLRFLVVKQELKERKEIMGNGIEIDESYFGPRRQRGKKGRGARKKIIVLGLRKRNGKVYGEIIPDVSRSEIMPIIRSTVKSGADIYTDGWRSYDALAVYGYTITKKLTTKNQNLSGTETFMLMESKAFGVTQKEDLANLTAYLKTFSHYIC